MNDDDSVSIIDILKEALYEFYAKSRDGIHVSDLVMCVRNSVYKRIDPLPLTDSELNNFSTGRGVHGALEALLDIYGDRFEHEKEVILGKVIAHIDLYDKKLKVPIEVKTYRITPDKIAGHSPPIYQQQQLRYYMAMTNSKKGILLAQYINETGGFPFKETIISLSDQELEKEREKLLSVAELYRKALENSDPTIAPHILYHTDLNYVCKFCPYAVECYNIEKGKHS